MIIILEGVDGSGKTTLAHRLCNALPGSTILHAGAPFLPPLLEYTMDFAKMSSAPVICDRWHLGELIYGPMYRNTVMPPEQFIGIESFLKERGALVVLCAERHSVVVDRLQHRGDDFDEVQLAVQAGLFEVVYGHSTLPKMRRPKTDQVATILANAYGAALGKTVAA